MAEGLDDAVWWNDGGFPHHDGVEAFVIEDVRSEWDRRVHDQGVRREVEEECAAGVEGHRMAYGGDGGPASRVVANIFRVFVGAGKEIDVSCFVE